MTTALVVALAVVSLLAFTLWQRQQGLRREAYIRNFELPRGLFDQLRKRRPHLTQKECQLVAQALRQFFLAHLKSGRQFVSMPSQVADDLWHEFILYTKNYQAFCGQAFGRFMHHSPAVALGGARTANSGLRRCWWQACALENIDPRRPSRLPLLFALDAKLGVADGFVYVPDCGTARRQDDAGGGGAVYCGGDFSSAGFDGGTEGFGDGAGHGSDGDAGGSDAGCGGGGCGGGD